MRKILVLITVVAFTAALAYAAPGYRGQGGPGYGDCPGYGQGYGHGPGMRGKGYGPGMRGQGYGPGMRGQGYGQGMKGKGYGWQNAPVSNLTEKDAKAAVEKVITDNYKGYSIEKVEKFERPRGNMFQATVTDKSGNNFLFMVNPWGQVRGPVLNK